jgi:ribosome biogenesis GTPase
MMTTSGPTESATDPANALVIAAHGRRGRLEDSAGDRRPYIVRGRRLRVVCGDRVSWQPGQDGEAVVTAILPRDNALERLDAARNSSEVLAANLTLLAAVCAPEPRPDWFLLDRYLCSAADMRVAQVIVWNKCDLAEAESDELADYQRAGYKVLPVSARSGAGMSALAGLFAGETGILVGQSGVGKSSLINHLVPDVNVSTAALSRASAEGRHTTTASVMHSLPDGGRLIDAPGVRDFVPAIHEVHAVQVGFREILAASADCRFADCRHLREPGCAVKARVGAGRISSRRYESYRRLLRSTLAATSG